MQLHNDFATHIIELDNPQDRPYSQPIDDSLLADEEAIRYLNREIHNITPDYLTFLPAYFWYFYFFVGWVYFSVFMFLSVAISAIQSDIHIPSSFIIWIIIVSIFMFIPACGPLVLFIWQVIRKRPFRTQYYFLKKEQKIAYYYRPLWKIREPYQLKIVDYKDVIPDLHQDKYNRNDTPLNLYVADPETGDITHHMKLEDYNVDPKVQWAFIRTYMESPAEDLPINAELCQAYPEDTSKSLFACADIIYRKNNILNTKHSGGGEVAMFISVAIYALGYLLQGMSYRDVKRAILNPEVKKLLTWDGKDNPYPIQPITAEAQKAFNGKNWQVNIRWIIAIVVNIGLFAWAVYAYNA